MGSDEGRTRSPGRIPPSPPTPDRRHSLAASHLEHGALSPLSMSPRLFSEDVKSARWRLFGHVLRMPRDTPPAQQAIDYYFADTGDATFRDRVRTGPGKPGKSWNLIIRIPGLESHGILAQVLETYGISCWQICMQQSCLLFWIV